MYRKFFLILNTVALIGVLKASEAPCWANTRTMVHVSMKVVGGINSVAANASLPSYIFFIDNKADLNKVSELAKGNLAQALGLNPAQINIEDHWVEGFINLLEEREYDKIYLKATCYPSRSLSSHKNMYQRGYIEDIEERGHFRHSATMPLFGAFVRYASVVAQTG